MKNIGIITLNGNYNFGNRLQNYALQKFLKKMDYNSSTIWRINRKNEFKERIKSIIPVKKVYRRLRRFRNFNEKFLSIDYINNEQIDINKYDYYITGSDQVWNPQFKEFNEELFLTFSPREKNISFAASFGVDEIPTDRREEFKEYLHSISHISVREESGISIIKSLDKTLNPIRITDPTFLLDKKEWETVMKRPTFFTKKDYVLLYFLGKNEQYNTIKEYADKCGYEIINLLDLKDKYYSSGPSEFLYLINNAKMIFTDSFHSTVFSIIFHKDFMVLGEKMIIKTCSPD